jgi:histone deacetylase 11
MGAGASHATPAAAGASAAGGASAPADDVLPPGKLPILYRPEYNITANGIEKLHSFDSCKYGRVLGALVASGALSADAVVAPPAPTRQELLAMHTPEYLDSLASPLALARILELPICWLPSGYLRQRVLEPMGFAAKGTLLAALYALQAGWAVNLGGGYHHASRSHGHGFCAYADLSGAVHAVRAARPCACLRARAAGGGAAVTIGDAAATRCACADRFRVMVVDLDAHQGNGVERDFLGDSATFIFDCFTPGIFPGDVPARAAIAHAMHYDPRDTGARFLSQLRRDLPACVASFRPQLVLYNAGTDCLAGDPLSGLSLSPAAIVARDEAVFRACRDAGVPVAMVLSGGYQRSTAGVIAQSLLNLNAVFGLFGGGGGGGPAPAVPPPSASREEL